MRYQNVDLHNVCELVDDDGHPGLGMLRLPRAVMDDINPGARNMARLGAGCEIRGRLADDGSARVHLQVIDDNVTPPVASVYHGCFCAQTVNLRKDATELVIKAPPKLDLMRAISQRDHHPFSPDLVRILLPNIHSSRILGIEGDLAYPEPAALPASTLLCYGSSITHGASSVVAEGSYAAQCARHLGCDLINLGFGGSAHMDAAIADHIAARSDWDVATFEMGINVRQWALADFERAIERFVGTVVGAHPGKPVFCMDLFTNDDDFRPEPTLAIGFRDAVRRLVDRIALTNVVYVDGRDVLKHPTGLRTDLVHPTDNGMWEMGANLAAIIATHAAAAT